LNEETSGKIKQANPNIVRLFLIILIVPLALAMLVYGVFANSITVLPQQDDEASGIELTESQVIRDVTVGGLTRLDSGTIQRTYSGKPPEACPT
jgi:hypothetical protein